MIQVFINGENKYNLPLNAANLAMLQYLAICHGECEIKATILKDS